MKILTVFLVAVTVWAAQSLALERGSKDSGKQMYTLYGTHLWGSPRLVFVNDKKQSPGANFRMGDGEFVGIPLLIPFQVVNVKDLQCKPYEQEAPENYENHGDYESGYEDMVGKLYHRKKQRLHKKPMKYRPPAPVEERNDYDYPPPPYYPSGPSNFSYGSSFSGYEKPKVHYQSVYGDQDDVSGRKYQRHSMLAEFSNDVDHLSRSPPPKSKHHHPHQFSQPASPPAPKPKFDWQYNDHYSDFVRQPHAPTTKTYPVFMDAVVTPLNCEPDNEALIGDPVSGYELANNAKDSPYKQYYNVNGYDQEFDNLYKEYKAEPPAHKHKTFEDFLYKKLKHGFFFKKFQKFMKKHEKKEHEEHKRQQTYYTKKPHHY